MQLIYVVKADFVVDVCDSVENGTKHLVAVVMCLGLQLIELHNTVAFGTLWETLLKISIFL